MFRYSSFFNDPYSQYYLSNYNKSSHYLILFPGRSGESIFASVISYLLIPASFTLQRDLFAGSANPVRANYINYTT